jgi:hypothetical protein
MLVTNLTTNENHYEQQLFVIVQQSYLIQVTN